MNAAVEQLKQALPDFDTPFNTMSCEAVNHAAQAIVGKFRSALIGDAPITDRMRDRFVVSKNTSIEWVEEQNGVYLNSDGVFPAFNGIISVCDTRQGLSGALKYDQNAHPTTIVRCKKNEYDETIATIDDQNSSEKLWVTIGAELEVEAPQVNGTDMLFARYDTSNGGWSVSRIINGADPSPNAKIKRKNKYKPEQADCFALLTAADLLFNSLVLVAERKKEV